MSKRIVVIPDTQLPYEDRKALKTVIRFIGEYQPDEVVHIGDLMDFPQPARWSKDTRAEFEGDVLEHARYGRERLLKPLRDLYSGPVKVHEGNHDLRPRDYLAKYAPALDRSRAFHFETLLDFDSFGIERAPDFNHITTGWITTHGHLAKISLSRNAGQTATNAAVNFQTSVVMGHTHRLGYGNKTFGFDGKAKVVTGVEVGNLMDMRQAHYLKRSTANWQQGFVILHVDGRHVKPEIVPISQGAFTVDGVTYKIGD